MDIQVGHSTRSTHSRLQKEILEPFSVARGFTFIVIDGNVDKNFAHSLMDTMRSPWDSIDKILEFSNAYLEKGDAAAAAGLLKAASLHYEEESHFTFFAGQSYVDKFRVYDHSVYCYIPIASMLDAFDVRWAKVLLKLRCYADVQCLVASVLNPQYRDGPTSTEKIQLVLCGALACLGLGNNTRFIEIMHDLFQGRCHPAVVQQKNCWAALIARDVFPDSMSILRNKDTVLKSFDDLVAYCNKGEDGILRRISTEGGLPNGEEIRFPLARDWSFVATRYQRRRTTWARNKSVTQWV